MKHITYVAILLMMISGCMKKRDQIAGNHYFTFPEQSEWAKSILDNIEGNVLKSEQKEFILYYKSGSYAEKNKEHLLNLIYSSIDRVKEVLKIRKLKKGFYIIMIDSRDEMRKLIGMRYKGLSSGINNAAIFVYSQEIRPYFRHELFHLISYNVWGPTENRLLNEGGATFCDNECLNYDNPITTINNYLYKNGMWFEIGDLIHNFSDKAGENDLIAYLESAFIFRYLYESYGTDKLKVIWKDGFSKFQITYGFGIEELERKIQEQLEHIELKPVDWDELMDKGCG